MKIVNIHISYFDGFHSSSNIIFFLPSGILPFRFVLPKSSEKTIISLYAHNTLATYKEFISEQTLQSE